MQTEKIILIVLAVVAQESIDHNKNTYIFTQ